MDPPVAADTIIRTVKAINASAATMMAGIPKPMPKIMFPIYDQYARQSAATQIAPGRNFRGSVGKANAQMATIRVASKRAIQRMSRRTRIQGSSSQNIAPNDGPPLPVGAGTAE